MIRTTLERNSRQQVEAELAREKRFWIAMAVYVALAVLEWTTLSAEPIRVVNGPGGEPLFALSVRGVALAVLVLFAVRTWIHDRRAALEEFEGDRRGSGVGRE